MKKIHLLSAIILACALLIPLLASCGKNGSGSNTTVPETAVLQTLAAESLLVVDGIELDKTSCFPGEKLAVTLTLTKLDFIDSAWLGIVPSSIEHGKEKTNDENSLGFALLNSRGGESRTYEFTAPSTPGAYDIRVNDKETDGVEVAYITFIVESETLPETTLYETTVIYPDILEMFPDGVPIPVPENLSEYKLTYYSFEKKTMDRFVQEDVFTNTDKYSDVDRDNARDAINYILRAVAKDRKENGTEQCDNAATWHILARCRAQLYYDTLDEKQLETAIDYYDKCIKSGYTECESEYQILLIKAARELPEGW